MSQPIICFGQQPCGFFPKRFLYVKFLSARRLQQEIGGEIVFFYHDSDHDPRETVTVLTHRHTGEKTRFNFQCANKTQKLFSPLCAKRILPGWQEKTARQLPNYADAPLVDIFRRTEAGNVADFCLEMYRRMGLLDGMAVRRSSDPEFRRQAAPVEDHFVDVSHEGEIVRARRGEDGCLRLHKGGDHYIDLPAQTPDAAQISPTRDTRLRWMQSVIHCTHYVAGQGEIKYLNTAEAPGVQFIAREGHRRFRPRLCRLSRRSKSG